MKMQKIFMAAVLVAAVGIVGLQQAEARDNDKSEDSSRQFNKMDDATKAKIEKFRADTKDLRKQMAMKRAEEIALIRSETPNVVAVKKTAEELFDMRTALREKAKAAGIFTSRRHAGEDNEIAEKHAKLVKFLEDTQALRKQIFVTRAEKHALMHSKTPNPEAVAKVAGELFSLKDTLREKAKIAGLPGHFHRRGMDKKGHQGRFSHGYDLSLEGNLTLKAQA